MLCSGKFSLVKGMSPAPGKMAEPRWWT